MPGFIAEIAKDKLLGKFGATRMENRVVGSLTDNKSFFVERRTINKFMNDKVFYEDEDFVVLTEGVVLNSLYLQEKYLGSSKSGAQNFASAVVELYKRNGEQFFADFRGSFSGAFYDKKADLWLVYTNHIGDKQLFYTKTSHGYAFASEVTWLTDYLKNNGFEYTLDETGLYCLLTYAFMLEDHTLFNEIKKVNAGQYVRIQNGSFEIKEYYKLDNTPNENESEEEIIENIDRLFRNAIKLEYEKDKEYGYKHFASLSGGLDSRMNVWVGHDLGYTDQLNWTMSQCDYLDEKIAKDIARDLKHEWIFKSLDNGNYLCGIVDDLIDLQFGTVFFAGSAHSRSFMQMFNSEEYGLAHTGQVGDAVLGSFLFRNMDDSNFTGQGAYSQTLIDKVSNIKLNNSYANAEIFKFYNRAFTGALQGNMITQEYTEVASPFLDVEFMNYCLHIPAKYRIYEQIYMKWIIRKYPEAAKYKWEKINAKITDKWVDILGRHILLKKLPKLLMNKFLPFTRKNGLAKGNGSMNPLDYWYATNPDLKNDMDEYYKININNFPVQYDPIRHDLEKLYTGNVTDKLLTLTALGAFKKYF